MTQEPLVASFAPQTSIFRSVCMCVARLESEVGSEAVPPKKEHQTQESWHICFQIFQAIFTITVGALAALGRPCLREGSEDLTVTGMLRHDCILGLVRRKHRQTWKTSMPLLLFFACFWIFRLCIFAVHVRDLFSAHGCFGQQPQHTHKEEEGLRG